MLVSPQFFLKIFLSSERYILSSSRDGTVRKLKIVSHPKDANLMTHKSDANLMTQKSDANRSENDANRFESDGDRITLEVDASFVVDHGECVMDMSVDGDWMMTVGSDAKICVWNIKLVKEDEEPLKRVLKGLILKC